MVSFHRKCLIYVKQEKDEENQRKDLIKEEIEIEGKELTKTTELLEAEKELDEELVKQEEEGLEEADPELLQQTDDAKVRCTGCVFKTLL